MRCVRCTLGILVWCFALFSNPTTARAWTQAEATAFVQEAGFAGTDIVYREGGPTLALTWPTLHLMLVDLPVGVTPGEAKYILLHELAHVVQYREGRLAVDHTDPDAVRPLEWEADVWAVTEGCKYGLTLADAERLWARRLQQGYTGDPFHGVLMERLAYLREKAPTCALPPTERRLKEGEICRG